MTEQLGTPPAPPKTASEAQAVLDARIADKSYGARLFNGEAAAKKEFHDLTAKIAAGGDDTVAVAMAGNPIGMPTSEMHAMAHAAAMFRDLGIRDAVTEQFLRGEQVTAAEYEAVQNWKTTAMGDLDFVKRYLSGDIKAAQQMTYADIVLVNGVKEPKPA
jgi:hypothetical protein